MQLEKSNQTRACRLVEHIVTQKSTNSFRRFCDALVGRYKWLVRDLRADLKVERGEVKPLPETLQETAALVHRSQLTFHCCPFRLQRYKVALLLYKTPRALFFFRGRECSIVRERTGR